MKLIQNLSAATAISILLGGTAYAAGLGDVSVEAAADPVIPTLEIGRNWTGAYGGLNLGYSDIDADGNLDGDDVSFGVHLGYDYDFGDYVLGAEVEHDETDIDLGIGADANSITRLKIRGGYDLGRTLVYVTAGAAYIDTSFGNETGGFIGAGTAYQATDKITIGAEVLLHRFNNIGSSNTDADVTTFNLRASYRF